MTPLQQAAQALVDRWDTPLWKDTPHTGKYIDALRAALSAPAGWQAIETAPENMTEPVVVRWLNSDGEEERQFDYKEDGCWMGWHEHAEHTQMIGGWGVSETPPYAHWLPLPAAPSPQEQTNV